MPSLAPTQASTHGPETLCTCHSISQTQPAGACWQQPMDLDDTQQYPRLTNERMVPGCLVAISHGMMALLVAQQLQKNGHELHTVPRALKAKATIPMLLKPKHAHMHTYAKHPTHHDAHQL